MGRNFWKFASVLEKDFNVPYDRNREVVLCPECDSMIVSSEWDICDYAYSTSDGYIVYRCPICGEPLTVRELDK